MLSVDVGYRYTKARCNGSVVFHQPTMAGPTRDLFEDTVSTSDTTITVGDETLFIGNLADRQALVKYTSLYEDRNEIDITKYLLLSAIAHAQLSGDVQIISGLPFSYYFKQKADFLKYIQELPKDYSVTIGGKRHDIHLNSITAKVVLQALGSYMNFMLEEDGSLREESKKYLQCPVCVVNLGFYTLEILSMNGMEIDHNRSYSSNELGSNVAYRIIQQQNVKNVGRLLSFSEIDHIIKTNSGNMEVVNQAFRVLGSQIRNELYSLNQKYGLIILSGGNARLIKSSFEGLSTYITKSPATDTVEGYDKIGARTWQRTVAR